VESLIRECGRVVILEDAPEGTTRLDHMLKFNDILEHFGNVSAGIVEQSASKKKLDDVVPAGLLIVVEKDIVGYIRLGKMRGEHLNSNFCSGMLVIEILHHVG